VGIGSPYGEVDPFGLVSAHRQRDAIDKT